MEEENDFTFDGQRHGEHIVAVVKNHPFVLYHPGLKMIGAWLIAAALIIFWSNQLAGPIAFVFVILGLGFFVRHYYAFTHSNFLITDQRVVNMEQFGFLARKITETEIKNIQDISSDTAGMYKTVLKFGDLVIRTSGASKGTEIIVKNIPNPYEVQQVIVNLEN
jgi:hypothetical protein